MSEYSLNINKINEFSFTSTGEAESNGKTSFGTSMWGTEIIKDNQPDKDKLKQEIAKKSGYKTTANPETYYDKKNKVYYRWNNTVSKFEPLNNAKKVYEDGSYLTNDKKHILLTGSVHDKEQKKYLNSDGKEMKEADFEAERLGYEKTVNPKLYLDKKTGNYYIYGKGTSLYNSMKYVYNLEKMLPSGAYIRTDGTTVDQEFNTCRTDKTTGKKIYGNPYGGALKEKEIEKFEARVSGYTSTCRENCYYDKANKAYMIWNKETQSFTKSDIQELSPHGAYIKGDKYYNKDNEEINYKRYIQNKKNLLNTNAEGIYIDEKTNNKYVWNESASDFEKYDPEAKKKAFLASKADGKLGDFEQGKRGDCWLIASLKALDVSHSEKLDFLKADENGNITVNMKGVNKKYTFTNAQINEMIKSGKYSNGDKDAIAIEAAFENYRNEIKENEQISSNRDSLRFLGIHSDYDVLGNGRPKLAIEILTGKGVSTITKSNDPNVVVKNNVAIMKKMNEETLKPYLDNKNYSLVAVLEDSDKNRKGEAHAFVIKGYDKENVYLINPYDTSKVETMKKEEFYKKLNEFAYTDLKSPIDYKTANLPRTKITASPEVKKYIEEKKKLQ